jgi:hypothetical protein
MHNDNKTLKTLNTSNKAFADTTVYTYSVY